MPSKSPYIATNGRLSFFLMDQEYFLEYVYYIFFFIICTF